MTQPLLEIKNLRTHFFTEAGVVKAVEDVSLTIGRGKTLGLVGESGCGKSMTALSVMGLVPQPGRVTGGQILFHDTNGTVDLAALPETELRRVRGARIAMIFQEPMTSLNPVFTVGQQIGEAIRLHRRELTRAQVRDETISMLRKVQISDPERRLNEYPHQFSGGMRQRVMIAMALSCYPQLLIADEPTTALDVTIQAQVLDLLRQLQADLGMSLLLITHDLGVVAEMADDVAVMYASKVVEYAPVADLYRRPLHPYSMGLFESRPKPGARGTRLTTIPGAVPSPLRFPPGCKFHPRCRYSRDICKQKEPLLRSIEPSHLAHCHFAGELPDD